MEFIPAGRHVPIDVEMRCSVCGAAATSVTERAVESERTSATARFKTMHGHERRYYCATHATHEPGPASIVSRPASSSGNVCVDPSANETRTLRS